MAMAVKFNFQPILQLLLRYLSSAASRREFRCEAHYRLHHASKLNSPGEKSVQTFSIQQMMSGLAATSVAILGSYPISDSENLGKDSDPQHIPGKWCRAFQNM
jgi:hypothetical protein